VSESRLSAWKRWASSGLARSGLPIGENLIKSGYRVVGYRRSSLAEFEKIAALQVASSANVGGPSGHGVLVPSIRGGARDVVQGPNGLIKSARAGQIIVELGHIPFLTRSVTSLRLAAKGAIFLDGEVSGTPGMVAARKAVIYLAGDKEACAQPSATCADLPIPAVYFGPFGAASRVKLVNNLLVAVHIAAAAEAMALA